MPRTTAVEPDPCPLCGRPNYFPSDHHLVPKSRGGKETQTICCDCHRTVHAFFSNKELEAKYYTAEALLAHEKFARAVRFLQKQDPRRRMRTKTAKSKGRN